jgi:HEAT repeat protein
LQLLAEIGPDASAAIPSVIPLLNNPNDALCGEAAFALVRITDKPEKTMDPLLKLLNGTNDHVHARIAEAMHTWDSSGKKAGPALLRLAASTNSHIQTPATIALAKVAPDLATNVLDQLKQIALMNYWHGYKAREILTYMGSQAKPVVDDLLHAAMSANHDKDSTLAIAVISIDPDKGKSLIPSLMQKTHSDMNPSEEKVAALKALSLLGTAADPALPLIKSLLVNKHAQVRTAATNALHAITSAPSAASTPATPP